MNKTDVLYVVGRDKAGDELRWSLRSLALHGKGVGRVVIAGYIPDFVNRKSVTAVEVQDISRANKHINILNCIVKAIECGAVRGDFQYSSDDHFLLRDVKLPRMPYWIKPGRLLTCEELRARNVEPTLYEAGLSSTRKTFDKLSLRTDLFCVHRNTWMSAADLPRVKEILAAQDQYLAENYGLEPTCAFMAARLEREPETQLTTICDRKLYGYDEKYLETADWLSTGDGMTDRLWQFLSETFKEPCKYEVP